MASQVWCRVLSRRAPALASGPLSYRLVASDIAALMFGTFVPLGGAYTGQSAGACHGAAPARRSAYTGPQAPARGHPTPLPPGSAAPTN